MSVNERSFDVIIIGSGPAGATVARVVRDESPDASILMVEAGGPIGTPPGRHLLGANEPDIRREYRSRAKPAMQSLYVADSAQTRRTGAKLQAGIWSAAGVGMNFEALPGAALAHNLGGMGIHWTTACPTAWGDEIVPFINPADWDRATARARQVFSVSDQPFPDTSVSDSMVTKLRELFPSPIAERSVRHMPMAGWRDEDGVFRRASPGSMFEPLQVGGDPNFILRTNTLCTGVTHSSGRVTGVNVLDLDTGEAHPVGGGVVVLAADALRTPQLLWNSAIRHSAIGKYLNEHTNLSAFTFLDADKLGLSPRDFVAIDEEEPYFAALWIPSRGADQPVHGQLMGRVMEDGRYRLTLTCYLRSDIDPSNRIEFSDRDVDAFGMPLATAHFAYSASALAAVEQARESQAQVGHALGEFDPANAVFMAPGNSLHYTGTVRMGAVDDGTSVCDPSGRVWGFDNLFLAGNGVIPTALSCNCTLTAATLAVLTGEQINHSLASPDRRRAFA